MTQLPLAEWESLLNAAEAHLGEHDLALRVGEHIKPWHTGLMGFILMTSRNVQQVGGDLSRFQHLLNDVYRVQLGMTRTQFFMTLEPSTSVQSTQFELLTTASWVCHARWLTSRPDLVFDAEFSFPQPPCLATLAQVFRGQIRFNQPRTEVRGAVDYLYLPVQQSDLSINQILRNTAFAQLEDLTATSGTFLAKLEKVIKTRLGHGPLALKEVARDMGMSTRTLQARLDRYGMTFRQLLDGVRHAQAKHALRNTDLPLTEIAFSLGFTTQTSFQHAFKRWTGTSPGSFRRSRSRTAR
jgi:AraC-like DNA-binding protein